MGRPAKPHYRQGHGHSGWYATVGGEKVRLISGDKEKTRDEAQAIFERLVAEVKGVPTHEDGSTEARPSLGRSEQDAASVPPDCNEWMLNHLRTAFDAVDWQAVLIAAKTKTVNIAAHRLAIDYPVLSGNRGPLGGGFPNPEAEFDEHLFRVSYLDSESWGTDNVVSWAAIADDLEHGLGIRHDGRRGIDSFLLSLRFLGVVYPKGGIEPLADRPPAVPGSPVVSDPFTGHPLAPYRKIWADSAKTGFDQANWDAIDDIVRISIVEQQMCPDQFWYWLNYILPKRVESEGRASE